MTFSAQWLALREPYDGRARNRDVLAAVVAAFAGHSAVSVVDLACGTGSTVRAIAPRLPVRQTWRLADSDLGLLRRAAGSERPAGDGPVDLVTTSALLDLVSDDWLERFVVETAARRLPVYAALTYDGRASLEPADRLDEAVIGAVNRHQRRDKGFGPALGPAAASAVIARFGAVGYAVVQGESDWAFGPDDRGIQREVLAGWAGAAQELGDLPPDDLTDWLTRRHAFVADGRARMRVGHTDVFARPTGTR